MSKELKVGEQIWVRVESNRVIDLDWFTPATIAERDMFVDGTKIRVQILEIVENGKDE